VPSSQRSCYHQERTEVSKWGPGRQNWLKTLNITYQIVQEELQRFLQSFLDDNFQEKMESWNGGMLHHMFSAALTCQVVQEMDHLPDLVGHYLLYTPILRWV